MRLALGIEYDGTGYYGWQRLTRGPSLQAELEAALSSVANRQIEVVCAGRTDAGVHAHCQVVHFDSTAERSDRAWLLGSNSLLPGAMAVLWVQAVSTEFHARYAARRRRYRYTILNRPVRPALTARQVSWERIPLDVARMREAAAALVGEHDFSAFRTSACQARSPVREVREITISRDAGHVIIEIEANAFLHHMVRNIVGSLLPVGRGQRPPGWPAELLAGRERSRAGPTAPASGLTFVGPRYPAMYGLPPEVSL
ncbi:MAG TPA: tRNA pseudouridine(38-40) synthase TruA [Rhodanobacteraceae bacterium]|nr:tRNA pseudouridine(38-40) synthase TruA [Rhodanobacteraceae bacterium]